MPVTTLTAAPSMAREYYYSTVRAGNYATDEEPIAVNCADFNDRPSRMTTRIPRGRLDVSVCYLAEGEMFFSLAGGEPVDVGGGTLLVVPPHTPMIYGQRTPAPRRIYWVHFTGSYAEELLSLCGFGGGGIFRLPSDEGATAVFTALLDEMRHPPTPLNRIRAAASTVMLLTHFGRLYERREGNRRLTASLSYIREHFTEEIDKEALAAMDGLGSSRYHALFRRLMGCTPAGYITSLRMSKARELLIDPDLPIGEVAARCGYADPLYFSRVFRRELGVSPSAYRRFSGDR